MKDAQKPTTETFPDTRWSLIQSVRGGGDLDEWCLSYWQPIYGYICACGYNHHAAEEMTQQFFERLIGKDAEKRFPEKLSGSFRAYTKRSVKNFLTDQWRYQNRKSREGGKIVAEVNDEITPDNQPSPDLEFDRVWLITVIETALSKLKQESIKAGKAEIFEKISPLLDGKKAGGEGKRIAQEIGMADGTFRVMLSRTRQRFKQLIEDEIRETVTSQEEFDAEIRYLFNIWS